ncbi:MAG TPA: HEAT repeat domain-containing protein [Microvirga sp.]|nr:HEAT repeat domain-containing protein [Microvirga sp.]
MLLKALWITAIAIAAVAIAVMVLLVAIRGLSGLWTKRRGRQREALLATLLQWLEGGVDDTAMKAALTRNHALATSLLIEIFELVRGEDQARLARLTDETSLPQYLRETLEVGRRQARLAAAESLVWFPSPETRAVLRFALHDRDLSVGLAAAASLAALGDELPIRQLLETRLGQEGETSRRLEAVLGAVAHRQAADLLDLANDEAAPERLRAAAIDALARTGSFGLLDPLARLAPSPLMEVRAAVARGLGLLGHPGAGDTILQFLTDPAWVVRSEAAEAAGSIGLVEAADLLCGLLHDPNWWVRFRAGAALSELGEQGVAMLKELADSPGSGSGQMASLILAERKIA